LCPLWVVAVLFYRDSLVLNLRMFGALGGVAVAARLSGKIKAIVQGIAIIGVLVVRLAVTEPATSAAIAYWTLTVVGVVTALSGLDYTVGVLRSTSAARAGSD
jgi:CDP-diacylglycerol--glycerol-3-phosphate 3-phosphatidyltransferase